MIEPSLHAGSKPLQNEELEDLFGWLRPFFPLALAVSGGVDSMCLLHLIHAWLEKMPAAPNPAAPSLATRGSAAPVQVLSVDHGLRAAAAIEAAFVKQQSLALGFGHTTLVWRGPKPETGLQNAARQARYALISAHLQAQHAAPPTQHAVPLRVQHAVPPPAPQHDYLPAQHTAQHAAPRPALVTAHHLDDQGETILMRLVRGSGLDGLTGMARQQILHELTILRPLLSIPKTRLMATVEARNIAVMEDPSNQNRAFERVRLRQQGEALQAAGLRNDKLALSARRLRRAREALDVMCADLARRAAYRDHPLGYAQADFATIVGALDELAIRFLARVIGGYGKGTEPVNLAKLEELHGKMSAAAFNGASINHCLIARKGDKLLICRETGRRDLPLNDPMCPLGPPVTLAPGQTCLWDRRFLLALAPDYPAAVTIKALGAAGWRDLKKTYPILAQQRIWQQAAFSLPAIWQNETLLGVPPLGEIVSQLAGPAGPLQGAPAGEADGQEMQFMTSATRHRLSWSDEPPDQAADPAPDRV